MGTQREWFPLREREAPGPSARSLCSAHHAAVHEGRLDLAAVVADAHVGVSAAGRAVLGAVAGGAEHVDDVVDATGLEVPAVFVAMMELERAGRIRVNGCRLAA